jgi:hypothetical protein
MRVNKTFHFSFAYAVAGYAPGTEYLPFEGQTVSHLFSG